MVRFVVLAALTVPASFAAPSHPAASPLAPPAAAALVEPATWRIDASHSELTFRIRHFVSKVRGQFGKWSGTITADPDNLAGASVEVTIDASTIDTNNERRDSDLRSESFFDAANHPAITFRSTRVEQAGTDLTITGELTMRGVTKPVVLTGSYIGLTKDQRGAERIGFEASTTINRLDWGITWNRLVEGGGAMLGDEVEIEISLAAVRQPVGTGG